MTIELILTSLLFVLGWGFVRVIHGLISEAMPAENKTTEREMVRTIVVKSKPMTVVIVPLSGPPNWLFDQLFPVRKIFPRFFVRVSYDNLLNDSFIYQRVTKDKKSHLLEEYA